METNGSVKEQPGCETEGSEEFTSKEFECFLFEEQTATGTVPAKGHAWREPEYNWESGKCYATRVCENDRDHVESETVKTVYKEKAPTSSKPGKWTETATFKNPAFGKKVQSGQFWRERFTAGGLKYKVHGLNSNTNNALEDNQGDAFANGFSGDRYDGKPSSKEYDVYVIGVENKTAAKLTVPATVKMYGVKFKVTAISASAFKDLKKLTAVTIGSNVKSIGKNAFYGCKKLKTITIKTAKLTASNVGAKAFKGIAAKAVFKCPSGKKKDYKTLLLKKGAPKTASFK